METTNHEPSLADDWAEDSSNLETQRFMPRPDRISSIPPAGFRSEEVRTDSGISWSDWRLHLGVLGVLGLGLWVGARDWSESAPESRDVPIVLDADTFLPVQVESPDVYASQSEAGSDESSTPRHTESTLERARQGDAEALEMLEEKPADQRTLDEIVALSEGRIQRHRDLAWAASILFASQNFEREHTEQIQMILAVVGDPQTFREGLLSLARIKNPIGADLIYQASQKYSHRPEVVEMAEDLLGTRAVIAQASPELSVVIDAIFVEECKDVRELLERTLTYGDRRAVRHLARFTERKGCGADGREDCFSCIREDDLLDRALLAAKNQTAPHWR